MMNVSTKQLRAFLALSQHRNFTRAAASICLSQPAFSALINGLEAEIGFRLFDRDTHRVRPTPDGESFAAIAAHLVGLYDSSAKEVAAIGRGERGRVCVAALPSVAVSWLPSVLPDFRANHPQVRVELIDALSDRCLQALADGVADFAITAPRATPPDMASEKLCEEAFHFVCRDDHPLAEEAAIRLDQLAGMTLLNFAGNTSIGQYLGKVLPGRVCFDSLEVEQLTTMMGLVAAGVGASIVPELALYQFRRPGIRIIALADFPVRREIHLITRTDRTLSSAATRLRAAIVDHAVAAEGRAA
ncbi:LysR family transcriptional regulator [Magnetospirillum sulfuroxidans]|uniref:LysR family transcriptional regulator n=1 Tax=Magnetospirillum sulfuroxidans TaxID=611300 RepID=A0ABS5IGH3_9PROT|nr:LysR family transcriptional regulator [Magnetospirillum sulfuroxidans]MBR9973485.1 LysR family transcriptional regulator [Magnetospirillum sulfuroxidans]